MPARWARLKYRVLHRALRRVQRIEAALQRGLPDASFQEVGAEHVKGIPSWTTEPELTALYTLAVSCPQGGVALEIGSYLGASSCYLAAGLKHRSGHLFCVDTWENQTMPEGPQDTFAHFQRNTAPFADVITTVRKRSGSLKANDIETPLDFAFIDGDHSFDAVASDFAIVSPWVREGGVIAFHDVGVHQFPGVSRVVGEATGSGEWALEGIVESLAWLRRTNFAPESQPGDGADA